MKLKSLQTKYIQKSRIFLYPLLNIRRGVSVTPIQTFITWQDRYTTDDNRLIGTYHLRTDSDFKRFEKEKLLGNPLFETFSELEDGTGAYVFDLKPYEEDYQKIVAGKYSKVSEECKNLILNFFKLQHSHQTHILSYLEPDEFMTDYAELFVVGDPRKEMTEYRDVLSRLRTVGELCSIPDLTLENLSINEKIVIFDPANNHSKTNKNHDRSR